MGAILPSTSGAGISSIVGAAISALLPYDKRMNDVSANGTWVTIITSDMNGSPAYPFPGGSIKDDLEDAKKASAGGDCACITQFTDSGDPIRIEPVTGVETGVSYNGKIISWMQPKKVRITLNLIPHSYDDQALSNIMYACGMETRWTKIGASADDVDSTCINPLNVTLRISQERYDVKSASSVGIMNSISSVASMITGDKNTKIMWTEFSGGRIISGPPEDWWNGGGNVSATGDGRFEPSSYVFEFTQYRSGNSKPKTKSLLDKAKDLVGM